MSKKYGVVISAHWEGDQKPQFFFFGDEIDQKFKDALCDELEIPRINEKFTWICSTCGWKGTDVTHNCKDSVLKLWADSKACKDLKDL